MYRTRRRAPAWAPGVGRYGLAAAVLLLCTLPLAARDGWSFTLFTGSAYNFRTGLTITQAGRPDIDMTARYDTKPFEEAPYYAWRLALERDERAWELQFIHHKIYLSNPPPEVSRFEATHGFNIFTLNRAFIGRHLTFRVGAGFVLAHPESVVRGQSYCSKGGINDSGYHFTGPALLAGVGRTFSLSKRFFISLDAQFIAARARFPVAGGHATAPNVAIHGLVGVGYRF